MTAQTKILIANATDTALNWLVAKRKGLNPNVDCFAPRAYGLSDGWRENDGAGAPIKRYDLDAEFVIELMTGESISVIRCDDRYGTDKQGSTTQQRLPVWAAAIGHQSRYEIYGSQGDAYGMAYSLSEDELSYGPTPQIAALRRYLSSFGSSVLIPTMLANLAAETA